MAYGCSGRGTKERQQNPQVFGNPLSCPSAPPSLSLFHHAHHRLQRSAALLSKRSYISPHLSIPLSVSTIWRSLGHHRVISLRKFETWQSLGHHWCEAHEVDVVVPQPSTGVAATWANSAVASAKPGSAWAGGLSDIGKARGWHNIASALKNHTPTAQSAFFVILFFPASVFFFSFSKMAATRRGRICALHRSLKHSCSGSGPKLQIQTLQAQHRINRP